MVIKCHALEDVKVAKQKQSPMRENASAPNPLFGVTAKTNNRNKEEHNDCGCRKSAPSLHPFDCLVRLSRHTRVKPPSNPTSTVQCRVFRDRRSRCLASIAGYVGVEILFLGDELVVGVV